MTYYSSEKRPIRKFRGTPQWTLEQIYITPFTAQRRYDPDGVRHYDTMKKNLHPTGVDVMDHYLRYLSEGKDRVKDFCGIYSLRTEDVESLVYILTGMSGPDFRIAYQLRLAADLLRYTNLPLREVAQRAGFGTHTNFCVSLRKHTGTTPSDYRRSLRQKLDVGRYKL